MSWLNFNESLSSLKGQISNFAKDVLNEGIVNTEKSVASQDDDDASGAESRFTDVELQRSPNVPQQQTHDSWTWDSHNESHASSSTNENEIVCNLQKKITVLENEKRELTLNLEQLDLDCQQTTDKLVTLKDNLQVEYDGLKKDFENLKKEFTSVLNENMEKSKEIQLLQACKENEGFEKLQKENNALNKQLTTLLKELKTKNKLDENLKELKNQCDNQLESLTAARLRNEELQKLYDDLIELTTKQKLQSDISHRESKITNLTLHKYNSEQNVGSFVMDSDLDNEHILNNPDSNCVTEVNKLKIELDDLQQLYNVQMQCNTELNLKIENDNVQIAALMQENRKLQDDCERFERDIHNANFNIVQLTGEVDSLVSNCEKLRNVNETTTKDCQDLQTNISELKKTIENKDLSESTENQHLHEAYITVIADKVKNILDTNASDTDVFTQDLNTSQFSKKVDDVLLVLKQKLETTERKLLEVTQQKNNLITEKNVQIETLDLEVMNKCQSLKDAEDECAELMKNNDLLITELEEHRKNNNLHTISESHEDNLLLLEIQLENANKRIHQLESIVIELETTKQDDTKLELNNSLYLVNQELDQNKREYSELLLRYKQLEEDKLSMRLTLEKSKADFENTEYKFTELTFNNESIKDEYEQLKNKHLDLENSYENLVETNDTTINKICFLQEAESELTKKFNAEVESNKDLQLQIQNLVERLQNSKMSETSFKLQVDTLNKELQSITEAKQIVEQKCEYNISEFNKNKDDSIKQLTEQFQSKIINLENQLQELTTSRDELISLIRTKHEENIRYHDEIQRLNQHLSTEIEKAAILEKQLNDLSVDNISHEEVTQKDQEIEKLQDQNKFLKEKCEILAQTLLNEQSNVQKALQECHAAGDREISSNKELERLRQHLVETEEAYTQELLLAEQKNKEMQLKVNEVEQREKDSNSIYTSVNIRANQQVESLQTQLQLITNQRDELRTMVSNLEDKENKQLAALTNLQLVLEQFQRDKEKDVQQETERIRRQIAAEQHIQEELKNQILGLKQQLEETKHGLQAASRLTDQLEKSKQQTFNYKDEILKLKNQLQIYEDKLKELSGSSELKVDKLLIKNLVLGYISSNLNDQKQILKVIATVLDFNQKESEKVDLNKPAQGSWLSAILHPHSLQSKDITQQSLSEAFVRFLENESKPKVVPNLLTVNQASKDDPNNGNDQQRYSPHSLQEVVLPTFEDFGSSRSSGSILKGILKNNS